MSIPITIDLVEATWDLLRLTPPFRRWKLPASDEIKITINLSNDTNGHYEFSTPPGLAISARLVGSIDGLVRIIAHEMIHAYHHKLFGRAPRNLHGRLFMKHLHMVCRLHHWDAKSLL